MLSTKQALQDAATVVLLRDGPRGLEVLMAKRSSTTRFSAGAYVFPGGAVDAEDELALAYCRSLEAAECERAFAEPQAQRYYLAAAREMFEEVGLWLFDDGAAPQAQTVRQQLHAGEMRLADVLDTRTQHACQLSRLKYFRFWTTPPGMPRRYRTRFFAALAPADQSAAVDGVELTQLCWTRPADMLQRYKAQEVQLIFPTIKELEYLAGFNSAQQAWASIQAIETIEEIRTRHRIVDGRSIEVLMPGDAGYAELPAW